MNDASKLCSYDQEYLSLLARQGKIKAEKIAGKWYTTVAWLNDYLLLMRPNMIIGDHFDVKTTIKHGSRKALYAALFSANAAIIILVFYYIWANFWKTGGNNQEVVSGLNNSVEKVSSERILGVSHASSEEGK
ncbi:hypothetical protein EPO05_04570 [Patescibacteria group bacterium]|nr:MAG: hypothetical protein EPO05_04570 [Patescibacteria group bacterium]